MIPHTQSLILSVMLSILPTPIGNLGDITERAKQTLQNCDVIICEDTRVIGQLLHLLELPKKELLSFHGNSDPKKLLHIIERLQTEHACLVSDAGTPGISDPGFTVVCAAREAGIHIEALPGPSAFLVALSVSGFPINQFVYYGFLPLKKGRQTLLKAMAEEPKTMVFYESVHRIQKTLHELNTFFIQSPERKVCICRELTKKHEEAIIATINDLPNIAKTLTCKGEFAIVISAAER